MVWHAEWPPLILVGEAPGPSYDPRTHRPLFPYPPQSAGGRLKKMSGYTRYEYIKGTERVNLIPEPYGRRWPKDQAVERAREILFHARTKCQFVFGFGEKVKEAFRSSEGGAFSDYYLSYVMTFPHPSGLCRKWNDPGQETSLKYHFDRVKPYVVSYLDRESQY